MVIMPWRITDYEGTGIVSPALDHIGFTVESLETFRADLERIAGDNPLLSPGPVGAGPEGKARLALAERSCPVCRYHLAGVDGIFLSANEANCRPGCSTLGLVHLGLDLFPGGGAVLAHPVLDVDVRAARRTRVELSGTGDPLIGILDHLLPLCEPTRRTRDRKDRGEHRHRDPERPHDHA